MLSTYLILLIVAAVAAQSGEGSGEGSAEGSAEGSGTGSGEESAQSPGAQSQSKPPQGPPEVDAEGQCLSNRIYASCYRKCEDSDCDTIVCGKPKCACNNGTALQLPSDPQNGIGCIAIGDCKC
ncbi:unnamed protein product [Heligmosomoides polygyrus]|uniref:TIL domain-containing protein n=1 Tax=Heligmosomoides polygyrus TaxID=6339 RepID=A0A183FUE0_HELPZ|nr:unnamed protein product [Heligmosomoides polygyrus]